MSRSTPPAAENLSIKEVGGGTTAASLGIGLESAPALGLLSDPISIQN
jgi:hypothetical protein